MAVALVTVIIGVLVIFYFYLTKNYTYWQKRGIPCVKGAVPGFGHILSVMLLRIRHGEFITNIYNDNRNKNSMVGLYNLMSPSLMVLEPELIKTVMQTNFQSFHQNAQSVDPDLDPLIANNPFFISGEKWTLGRKRLTYAFSSMRLKILLENIKIVCQQFEDYLNRKLSEKPKLELELKDLFSKYTSQVVASAGFGIDGHSFNEEEEKNKMSFRNIIKTILEPSTRNMFMMTLAFTVPVLNEKLFRLSMVPKHIDHYFRSLVTDIMEQRRKDGIVRNDFLQLMVELERMENDKFDAEILASHALSFILDGYETSSNVMSYVGFQLAAHPEVQEKLREEVTTVLAKYDGTITYEALREMTYMEQVISESQRIIPVLGVLNKLCTEDCELKGSDGLVCHVKRGNEIIIPVEGLHKDPQYWNDPDKFDPDRFAPDRKQNIEKFTFLPFGEGPRMCVGMRMALLQIKACLATLLSKYRLELSPKTRLPLKFIPGSIFITPQGGFWVYIQQL